MSRGYTAVGVSRGYVAVIAVLLALGTGGCTQDQPDTEVTAPTFADASPRPSEAGPSASAPAEPSPAPTEAAPPLPDLAKQQTPEGAVAFTQWWFETLNYATATGDTTGLRAGYEATCISCENFATRVENAYQSGGSIDGAEIQVLVDVGGSVESGGAALPVFTTARGGRVLDADGVTVETLTAEEIPLVAAVLWRETGWTMGDLSQ